MPESKVFYIIIGILAIGVFVYGVCTNPFSELPVWIP